jgi:DNA-binding winged helix-turn-helix (wHTH) protein
MLLRFADCELDAARRTLRRAGALVDVDPKAFDLLVLLAERAGALLPRAEMIRALWPDTVVSEAAVSQCVRRARVAIGDLDRSARRIETLSRHGLRLAVAVSVASLGSAAGPAAGPAGFVGRRSELSRLEAELGTARAGRSRVVLVAGEPGIGKTRLVEELLARASDHGCAVAWGRCHEDVDMPAYWPWSQAARALVERLAPGGLAGEEQHLLERVLPGVRVPGAGALDTSPSDSFARFDLWTRLLAALARRAPLVVALDDLQWADSASLLLLRFLARERPAIPLLVVGTFRDAEARGRGDGLPLAELAGGRDVLALGALDEVELAALAGGRGDPASIASLHRLTGGNPYFAVEILGALGAAPLADAAARSLPRTVRGFVADRVARLAAPVRALLEAAAVLGEALPAQRLAGIAPEGTEVAPALHALVAGGLLRPRGPGELAFAHALVREVVYDALPDLEKASLHERAVRAIEAEGARAGAAPPVETLARHAAAAVEHRARAGAAPDARLLRGALRHAERAARHAAEIGAWEEAARHAARALALPGVASVPADLAIALGEAQMQSGQLDAGTRTLRAAAGLARRRRSWSALARIALARVGRFGRSLAAEDAESLALLDEVIAAERLRPGDPQAGLAARVLARRAIVYRPPLPPDARATLLGRAETLARSVRQPLTLAYVLWARHVSSWDPRERVARSELSGELLALGQRVRDVEVEALARICAIRDAVDGGDLAALGGEIAAYEALVDRVLHPVVRFYLTPRRVMHALAEGRIAEAERVLLEGLQHPDVHGVRAQIYDPLPGQLVLVRREQGRLPEIEGALEAVARMERVPFVVAFQGLIDAAQGRLAAARAKLGGVAAQDFRDVAYDHNRLMVFAVSAELCAHTGDADRAALLEPLLAPFAGQHVVAADGLGYLDSVARPLGLLALAQGDRARAAAHLEEALRVYRAIGAPARAAHAQIDLAAVVESRDRRAALLGSAAEAARALGLAGLEAEAERARATLH